MTLGLIFLTTRILQLIMLDIIVTEQATIRINSGMMIQNTRSRKRRQEQTPFILSKISKVILMHALGMGIILLLIMELLRDS